MILRTARSVMPTSWATSRAVVSGLLAREERHIGWLYLSNCAGSIRGEGGSRRRDYMFGKKSDAPKTKSPLNALIEAIDQLGPGQQLMYKLAEMYEIGRAHV